ncbi:hypothetical protein SynSYN20_02784 [Synechococcus sp. SYN20]|nr:hypothetical protein SynMVIR181_02468 [Synechococcus sp. MVIR-18-1]QNJ27088.1 hypothetical protein SynSYN20_02784 [Synechococcus sp. SYN20]
MVSGLKDEGQRTNLPVVDAKSPCNPQDQSHKQSCFSTLMASFGM